MDGELAKRGEGNEKQHNNRALSSREKVRKEEKEGKRVVNILEYMSHT